MTESTPRSTPSPESPSQNDTAVAHSAHRNEHTTRLVEEALKKMHRSRTVRADTWTSVQDLLKPLLVSFPAPSDQYRRSLTHRVAAYVLRAVIEMHVPLLASDLFTDTLVRRFVTTNYTNPNTRSGYESVLQRFVLHTTGHLLESRRVNTSPTVTVYSRRELANIRSWAASRPEQNRLDAVMAVALAGGAGLRSIEISRVRTSDISIENGNVFVDVSGKMPRRIAMREEWTPSFLSAFELRANKPYVVKPNIVTARSRRQRTAEVFQNKNVDRAKLRDTWVVGMLDRLPIRVICHIAGYTSLIALLARYETFSKLDDLRIIDTFQDVIKAANR